MEAISWEEAIVSQGEKKLRRSRKAIACKERKLPNVSGIGRGMRGAVKKGTTIRN